MPYPAYLRVLFGRTSLLWLLSKILVLLLLWLLGAPLADALAQPVGPVVAVLAWLDRRFFHETTLLANLAAEEVWCWTASLAAALSLDGVALLLASRAW